MGWKKTVSSQDAPRRLSELVRVVSDDGDRYVVEPEGVPEVAVVPIALYNQWKRGRKGFFSKMRESARRVDVGELEAIELSEEAKRIARSLP